MTESTNNSHKLSLGDALGVLASAAEERMKQWAGVGEGESPDALIDDLWNSASSGDLDAQGRAETIEAAIGVYREHRDAVLDANPMLDQSANILADIEASARRIQSGNITTSDEAAAVLWNLVKFYMRKRERHNDKMDSLALMCPPYGKRRSGR